MQHLLTWGLVGYITHLGLGWANCNTHLGTKVDKDWQKWMKVVEMDENICGATCISDAVCLGSVFQD